MAGNDPQRRTLRPAYVGKPPAKGVQRWLITGFRRKADEADDDGSSGLRAHQPGDGQTAEAAEEAAPPDHSMTSSARARMGSGTSMPMALAARWSMMNSKRVGCSTGSSRTGVPLAARTS